LLVNLLPGESAVFTVRTGPERSGRGAGPPLDPIALTAPPVLRCVNDMPVHRQRLALLHARHRQRRPRPGNKRRAAVP